MIGLLDREALLLVGGAVGVLVVASIVAVVLSATLRAERHQGLVTNLRQRTWAWWIMIGVLAIALALGELATVLLFAVLSILGLREMVRLLPDRQRDRALVVWMLAVITPLHYWFVAEHWYGMFAIFIPVYAFLFLPAVMALGQDTTNFLQRAGVVQWALMVCVYAVSHVPAILYLPVAIDHGKEAAEGSGLGTGGAEGAVLMLFMVIVVQGSDVFQYVWGKSLGRHAIVPRVSPNKTWEGFIGGVLTATALGAALHGFTPFTWWQAGLLALISCLLGFVGGLVMSSIKRDRGVKDFGDVIPGHGGIMDRFDSLVFAAPVFFHLVRFFFAPV